jgi:hypothetical protein
MTIAKPEQVGIARSLFLRFAFSKSPEIGYFRSKSLDLDFRFWIDSTDKSGGLYYQEILGHKNLILLGKQR